MEILEANKNHFEKIKDLLVELQAYIVLIDKYNLNILSPQYREKYFRKTWKETYQNEGKIFVAMHNDEILGMIAGHIRKYDKDDRLDFTCPKMGIVEELIVSKECRNGGIGRSLIETMEKYFLQSNCKFVKIGVFAYNENAIKFYQKQNYENRFVEMIKKL